MRSRSRAPEELYELGLDIQESLELMRDLKRELNEIKAVADALYFKAQISHSLIVVRKIGEDKVEELTNLLD